MRRCALRVRGKTGSEVREFLAGVGESAHAKHQFRMGNTISGEALPVANPRLETVEFYKVSNLKDTVREVVEETPPPLVYRERGDWRPGRHGMSYTEEDWVDGEATSRRGPDE